MANVTITLHVDTDNVTQETVDTYCRFSDNNHQEGVTEPPEEYTTIVRIGDVVTWNGIPKHQTSGASVLITEISYEQIPGSTNLFGVDVLTGVNGIVTGAVQGHPGSKETYLIKFDVKQGDTIKHLYIDPKIDAED